CFSADNLYAVNYVEWWEQRVSSVYIDYSGDGSRRGEPVGLVESDATRDIIRVIAWLDIRNVRVSQTLYTAFGIWGSRRSLEFDCLGCRIVAIGNRYLGVFNGFHVTFYSPAFWCRPGYFVYTVRSNIGGRYWTCDLFFSCCLYPSRNAVLMVLNCIFMEVGL